MPSKNDVTLVVTSCKRYDLLSRTLESFYRFNTCPLAEVMVAEDWDQKGQVRNIERAYLGVKTELVMHLEEDWEFYRSGFIEMSIPILDANPKVLQVWLRAQSDTNGHPVKKKEGRLPILDPNWLWGGFSWNPGLRRLSDWRLIGGYMKHWQGSDNLTERYISHIYRDLGYVAVIPDEKGFVRHIGWGRSV